MYAYEIERDIIGSLMNYTELMNEVRDILTPIKFSPENRPIFNAIVELEKQSKPTDLMMVINYLKSNKQIGDLVYLTNLNDNYQPNGIEQKAAIINEYWMKRELIEFGRKITKYALDESNDVYTILSGINKKTDDLLKDNSSGVFHIKECIDDVFKVINDNYNNRLSGVLSGLNELDAFTHGDQKGDLIIVAGETSQGKTAFALSKAFYQALNGYKVAVLSYEMSRNQITARIMAMAAEVSAKKILMERLPEHVLEQLNTKLHSLIESNLYIIEVERKDLAWLESKIKTIVSKYKIESVIIDYIQMITIPGLPKNQQIGDAANALKFLAKHKNVNIPITLLSQFKRSEGDPKPSLSRLKESGDIENAADTVLGIWRPEHYGLDTINIYQGGENRNIGTKDVMIGHILKGRNIGLKDFVFGWNAELTKVSNITTFNSNPF